MLLILETLRGGLLVRQEALAGDPLVLQPAVGREDVEVEARIRELGGMVRRKLPATGAWLVSFANAGLEIRNIRIKRDCPKPDLPDSRADAFIGNKGGAWGPHASQALIFFDRFFWRSSRLSL